MKMKRKLAAFILTFFVILSAAGVLTACGKKKENTLVVATNAYFAPFEYYDGTEITGIDIDIARIIADELGWALEIRDMEFDSVIVAVAGGDCNIGMAGMTITETRKKSVSFTAPYINASQTVIAKTSDTALDGATSAEEITAALKGKKIGVIFGYTGQMFVEGDEDFGFDGIEGARVETYTNGSLAAQALKNGSVDYVILDNAPATAIAANNPGLKIIGVPLTEEEYAFCVSHDAAELNGKINEIIAKIKGNGKLDEIISKYYSEVKTQDNLIARLYKTVADNIGLLGNALLDTFIIAFFGFVIGLVLGTAVAVSGAYRNPGKVLKIVNKVLDALVFVIRGTPIVVQLLIFYFILLPPLGLNAVLIAVLVFGVNSGAYMSETIRGSINAVPKGQLEAGRALGLSYFQTMLRVVLPQAYKNAVPQFGNEMITLVKETSVVGFITVIDITRASQLIIARTYDAVAPYLFLALLYLGIVFGLTAAVKRIERRLRKNA